jgi:rRNA maturation endonuclease Nob1
MQRAYILDAGAFLSTWTQKNPDADLVTVPSILGELHNRPSESRAQTLISTGRLRQEAPAAVDLAEVRQVARDVGDVASLSDNDIELLALALSKKKAGYLVTVVSTDLSLLNTASFMHLDILDIASRLSHQIRWTLKCPACGHVEKGVGASPECPVCGTTMRRSPVQKRRIR